MSPSHRFRVLAGHVTLRPARDEDRPFLYRVYASTRENELAKVPWDRRQKEAFLQFQFDAQDRHYRVHFPDAAYQIVCVGGLSVGRFYVDRRLGEIRLLDIALLPEFRGAGIGGGLLRDLMAEASLTGRPLRLHVERENAAGRLYDRLGFREIGTSGIYRLLEWRNGGAMH